jgi:hypothetical protein
VIELGGKRLRRVRVAALERDVAAWDYEAKRVDVFTKTTTAFVDVLSAQAKLALNEDLVRLAEQVLRTVAARVQAGQVSPVEETRARVALSTSRIALERAGRELEAAREKLAAAWASTRPLFERVEGALERLVAVPSAEQLARRITQNPDIARWVAELAQRHAAVELQEAKEFQCDGKWGVGGIMRRDAQPWSCCSRSPAHLRPQPERFLRPAISWPRRGMTQNRRNTVLADLAARTLSCQARLPKRTPEQRGFTRSPRRL